MTPHDRFEQFNREACEADGNQERLTELYKSVGEQARELSEAELFKLKVHVTRTMGRCVSYLAELDEIQHG